MDKEILSTNKAPAAIGPYSQGIAAVLEAAGSSLDKVVKTTCFLADINDFAAFNEVYARMMPKTGAPSRSAVGIAALPKGAKVEIEAIAIR